MERSLFQNLGYKFRHCGDRILHYDQACLEINNRRNVSFFKQYTECRGCDLQFDSLLPPGDSNEVVVNTVWPLRYRFEIDNVSVCNGTYHFGEYGRYEFNVTEKGCPNQMVAEPDAAYLPLLTVVVVLLGMATLWYLVKGFGKWLMRTRTWSRLINREDGEMGPAARALAASGAAGRGPISGTTGTRSRLKSMDVFRGACVAMMIFVNSGGGGYSIFNHAPWYGLTLADYVFPGFAWLMGAAMVLSINARVRTSVPRKIVFLQVLQRSLILALIGIVLGSAKSSWYDVRLPGVLQRLAAGYMLAGVTECWLINASRDLRPGSSLTRDVRAGWAQWLVTLMLVAVHTALTFGLKVPDCPRGYQGPGGLHHNASYVNCTGGAAGYIDRVILGENHLYNRGTFRLLYGKSIPYDPEGLLGVLSSVVVIQSGAQAARIILHYNHARARIMRWVGWAIMMGSLSAILATCARIPISKNLWSLSYCLATSAISFFIQAVLYFFVDLKRYWGGRPLYYAGQNALALYIGSVLLQNHFPLFWDVESPTHAQYLTVCAFNALCWIAVAIALHRKGIFLSV